MGSSGYGSQEPVAFLGGIGGVGRGLTPVVWWVLCQFMIDTEFIFIT